VKATKRYGTILIEVEGATQKDLFREIARADELLGERCCGQCQSEDLRFVHRENDGNEFFELVCQACGAYLFYSQIKAKPGTLFPNRKIIASGPEAGKPHAKKGEYDKKYRGWTKYRGPRGDDE
jgi:hypothetical protein